MKNELWIDALDFTHRGGWVEDTQFVQHMGSGYLMASDIPGEPVADAWLTVDIPESRTYRVWVRNKNWYPTHSPGRFHISVGDQVSPVTMGVMPSPEWVWQIAGDFSLKKGPCILKACDETGYFSRFSSILITDQMHYVPPRPVKEFERERARIKGIDLTPQEMGSFDFVVAGAGPAGIPAAISAARHGLKVALVNGREIVGGNSSIQAGVGFDGASARQPNAREGGIAEEIKRAAQVNRSVHGKTMTDTLQEMIDREENITQFNGWYVAAADCKGHRIRSVTAVHIRTGEYAVFRGSIFADCTGDSWLGYYAGADFRVGREARWEYGEQFAPETADTQTMSGCIMGRQYYFPNKGPQFQHMEEPVAIPRARLGAGVPSRERLWQKYRRGGPGLVVGSAQHLRRPL